MTSHLKYHYLPYPFSSQHWTNTFTFCLYPFTKYASMGQRLFCSLLYPGTSNIIWHVVGTTFSKWISIKSLEKTKCLHLKVVDSQEYCIKTDKGNKLYSPPRLVCKIILGDTDRIFFYLLWKADWRYFLNSKLGQDLSSWEIVTVFIKYSKLLFTDCVL